MPLPAETVLLRRRKAQSSDAEPDSYWKSDGLPPDRPLPASDLVKAVHAYTSYFYATSVGAGADRDWCSMDETALLALGVLLEELAAGVLGETGDVALTEAEHVDARHAPKSILMTERSVLDSADLPVDSDD